MKRSDTINFFGYFITFDKVISVLEALKTLKFDKFPNNFRG